MFFIRRNSSPVLGSIVILVVAMLLMTASSAIAREYVYEAQEGDPTDGHDIDETVKVAGVLIGDVGVSNSNCVAAFPRVIILDIGIVIHIDLSEVQVICHTVQEEQQ